MISKQSLTGYKKEQERKQKEFKKKKNSQKKKIENNVKKEDDSLQPQSEEFTKSGIARFTIPLQPITKKNSGQIIKYKGSNGKPERYGFVPSKQYRQYEKDCAYFIPKLHIKDPINIKASFYMKTRGIVDLTNLNEALHDIMQNYGCINNDNCRIVISTDGSRVYYDKENPRTEVIIERIDNYVNPFS